MSEVKDKFVKVCEIMNGDLSEKHPKINKIIEWSVKFTSPRVLLTSLFIAWVLMGWLIAMGLKEGEDKAVEKCMQRNPDWTYNECESAVIW